MLMKYINQFSMLTLSIFPIIAFALALIWRRRPRAGRVALGVGIVMTLALGFVIFQPSPVEATPEQVTAWLDAPTGRPLFLEFYSHY
ncbi:MAG: DUF389 domain-containing protein [Chloroflexi bacterium]|nr:DUF389 domain-containing protein [Chloroflexota bacterium]